MQPEMQVEKPAMQNYYMPDRHLDLIQQGSTSTAGSSGQCRQQHMQCKCSALAADSPAAGITDSIGNSNNGGQRHDRHLQSSTSSKSRSAGCPGNI